MENLYKSQKIKSLLAVENNKYMIKHWLNQDKENLSLNISLLDNLNQFYASNFKIKENDGILSMKNNYNWEEIVDGYSEKKYSYKKNFSINNKKKENNNVNYETSSINQNIILKNKIIKLKDDSIHLRSLSVECEINILMSGESNFFIFSRCNDKFSENTAICCISKEIESPRKFISFGILQEKENNYIYKYIKKQEIPHQNNHNKSLDISEINFIFIDNGDNKCFLFLTEPEYLNSNLFLIGDFYVPIDTKSNIMFCASGDLISIKKLIIKQSYRNSYKNYKITKVNSSIQSCSCCTIF